MPAVHSNTSAPAIRHTNGTLHATAAAAIAAGIKYRGIWFNADGTLNVVDLDENAVSVTGVAGSVYPLQNFGAVTGAGTSLLTGEFIYLHD